jgi:ubiquinone biosynthesis protein COQ4
MSPTHFLDPRRPAPRFRPFKAIGHFRNLIADKEDTAEVFHIAECLPSKRFNADARAFCASAQGQALMASEPFLPDLLDDHDMLLAMPEGSVAHAYVAFMRAEGLSAAGLVEEAERPFRDRPRYDDQFRWYNDRLRDTHDLVHVLTGYGRDALGEQCALGFSSGQYAGLTDVFLSWAGAFELRRRVKIKAPVLPAVAEARRNGKAAQHIYAQNVRALLAEPLEAARVRMRIPTPLHYQQVHQAYRQRGVDPYNLMAAVPA